MISFQSLRWGFAVLGVWREELDLDIVVLIVALLLRDVEPAVDCIGGPIEGYTQRFWCHVQSVVRKCLDDGRGFARPDVNILNAPP